LNGNRRWMLKDRTTLRALKIYLRNCHSAEVNYIVVGSGEGLNGKNLNILFHQYHYKLRNRLLYTDRINWIGIVLFKTGFKLQNRTGDTMLYVSKCDHVRAIRSEKNVTFCGVKQKFVLLCLCRTSIIVIRFDLN
jgi:hypothetical protein